MTDGSRTIQVTEEEYEHLMRLRAELERRKMAGEKVEDLPGGRKSAEFGMGAVAGIAAYWLYKELMEDDAVEVDDDEEDGAGTQRTVKEIRPTAVVKSDPRRRRRR